MKNVTATAALLVAALAIAGCQSNKSALASAPHPTYTLHTTKGDIIVELDREKAPISVDNFAMHAKRGDYNGTVFHRVVPDFVIQGGGWTPELVERAALDAKAGHPDTPIKNEWTNGLKNARGTIAMAREEQPDTATREFYINLKDNTKLDTAREKTGNAGYAVFGRVIKGMDVVDAIAAVPTHAANAPGVTDGSMENVPVEPVVLISMR